MIGRIPKSVTVLETFVNGYQNDTAQENVKVSGILRIKNQMKLHSTSKNI